MADDDPFNRLSGTNGLAGAADGTLILMRNKRQDGTATLYATGRDIEDVEEELEFVDCRWSRAVPPEQLQLTLVVNELKKLLAAEEFRGTATELATQLETQGSYSYMPQRLVCFVVWAVKNNGRTQKSIQGKPKKSTLERTWQYGIHSQTGREQLFNRCISRV